MIIYEKGKLLFIFNFHSNNSYESYHVGTMWQSDHFILYESDEDRFGGHKRIEDAHGRWFETIKEECNSRPYKLRLYVPNRTCIVLCPYENTLDIEGEIKGMPQVTERQRAQVKGQVAQPKPQAVEMPKEVPQAPKVDEKQAVQQIERDIAAQKSKNEKELQNEKQKVDKKFIDLMDDLGLE